MRNKQRLINLYKDENISNVKIVFSIANEEDLHSCWDFFEQNINDDENESLQTLLVILFNTTDKLLRDGNFTFFEVVLEQSDECYYFTIWNKIVTEYFVKLIVQLHDIDFLSDAVCITIKIDKVIKNASCPLNYQEEQIDPVKEKVESEVLKEQKIEIKSNANDLFIPPYTFLNDSDLEELLELCDDMVDIVASADGILTYDNYIKLRSIFSAISLIMGYYKELYEVSEIMKEFSVLVNASHEKFVAMNSDEIALVDGFVNNIDRWVHTVFVKGGADIHFMDDSLKADFETIKMLVEPEDEDFEENLDDIFDF